MNKKNNRKGFTIVELVIVIAVIAILATVLAPTFGNIIGNTKKTAAIEGARNQLTEYFIENAAAIGALNVVIKDGDYYFAVIDGNLMMDTDGNVAVYNSANAAIAANTGLTFDETTGEGASAVTKTYYNLMENAAITKTEKTA